jgi:cytochrome c1
MNAAAATLVWAIAALGTAAGAAADELRDPTRPPMREAHGAQVVREAAPVLSAVMTFNGRRTAIFNGRLVRDGSVVGPYTIASVLEDGVRYRRSNEMHELHLAHTSTVKKPAAEPARASSGEQQ